MGTLAEVRHGLLCKETETTLRPKPSCLEGIKASHAGNILCGKMGARKAQVVNWGGQHIALEGRGTPKGQLQKAFGPPIYAVNCLGSFIWTRVCAHSWACVLCNLSA